MWHSGAKSTHLEHLVCRFEKHDFQTNNLSQKHVASWGRDPWFSSTKSDLFIN